MIGEGKAERERGSGEVEEEERPGGEDSEGEEDEKEGTVTPEAIPLTHPRSWEKLHIWSHFPGRKKRLSKNILSFSPHPGARTAQLVTSEEGGVGK